MAELTLPPHQSIVELVNKNRPPAMYPYRDYVEAGGLMAYEIDPYDLGQRLANDVPEILNGAKPGDIRSTNPPISHVSSI